MNKQTTTTTTTEAEVEETTEVLVLVTEQDAEKVLVESGLDRLMKQREQGVVNPIMLAQAIGVRPQMIYNYIRSGRIVRNDPTVPRLMANWCETHTAKAEAEGLDEGVQKMSHNQYHMYYMNVFYEHIAAAIAERHSQE
jgi:hypothetical protein